MPTAYQALITKLKERRRFFVELVNKAPGFADGYANGLNEAISEIEKMVKTNEVVLEDTKLEETPQLSSQNRQI